MEWCKQYTEKLILGIYPKFYLMNFEMLPIKKERKIHMYGYLCLYRVRHSEAAKHGIVLVLSALTCVRVSPSVRRGLKTTDEKLL